jgi:hypothetical protein
MTFRRSAAEHTSVPVARPVATPVSRKSSPRPGESIGQFAARHGQTPDQIIRKNSHLLGRGGHITTDMQLTV